MKSIILCADDYGQTKAISQAIIQLVKQKRVSAVSCLTTSPLWRSHALWLKDPIIQADIGLHFNLTEGKPLSASLRQAQGERFPVLPRLLLQAHLRRIKVEPILAELNAQIDEFEAGLGYLPDFIDGHQHVHQLPVIREAVLAAYESRLRQRAHCYIRSVDDPRCFFRWGEGAYLKRCIIQLSGASAFKKQLQRRKIPHNASFAGIYTFNQSGSFACFFKKFLAQITDNGLIMCHPGLDAAADNLPKGAASCVEADPISYSRPEEYRYLLSPEFLNDCRLQHVVLTTAHSKQSI